MPCVCVRVLWLESQLTEEHVVEIAVFIGGCFALPWLWVVNALYFWPKIRDGTTTEGAKRCASSCLLVCVVFCLHGR